MILKKSEILQKIKTVKYKDLWDLVYRFQLTYDEIIDMLDLKYIPAKRTGYSLAPGDYKITDIYLLLEHLLPNNVKSSIAVNDIRLKTSINFNQTLVFSEKSFFTQY